MLAARRNLSQLSPSWGAEPSKVQKTPWSFSGKSFFLPQSMYPLSGLSECKSSQTQEGNEHELSDPHLWTSSAKEQEGYPVSDGK